jgi:hypothetical protein
MTKFPTSNAVVLGTWTSPTNCYDDDTDYMTSAGARNTNWQITFGTFGFTLPTDAVINSVTFYLRYKLSTTSSAHTLTFQSMYNGTTRGTDTVSTAEPTTDTTITKTLNGTWTVAELNNALAQASIILRRTSTTACTYSFQYVSITVDYTDNRNVALDTISATTGISDAGQKGASKALDGLSATFGGSVVGWNPAKSKALDPLTAVTGASVVGRKGGTRAIGVLSATGNLASGWQTNRNRALGSISASGGFTLAQRKEAKKALDPISAVTNVASVGKKGALRALGSLSAMGGFALGISTQRTRALPALTGVGGFTLAQRKGATRAIGVLSATTGVASAVKKSGFIIVSLTGVGSGFVQFTTQRRKALDPLTATFGGSVAGAKQGGDVRYGSFDFVGATVEANVAFVTRRIGSFSLPSSVSFQAQGRKNGRGVSVIISEANLSLNALKRAVVGLTLSTMAEIMIQDRVGFTGSFALSGGTVILYVSNVVPIIQKIPIVLVAGMNPMQLMAGKQLLTIVVPSPSHMELVAGQDEMQMVIVDPMNVGEI